MKLVLHQRYSCETGCSLANFKNLIDKENGIPLSFLEPYEEQINQIKSRIKKGLEIYYKTFAKAGQKEIIEQKQAALQIADNAESIFEIIDDIISVHSF